MKSKSSCSKAGRPRCFCPDAALDRAIGVFWRKGYDGTSLTDLTDAMGINRPSLYAAYGNKESLFRLAMAKYGEQAAGLLCAANRQPTARGFIEHLMAGAVGAFTDPKHPPGCFAMQGAVGSFEESDTLRQEVKACKTGQTAAIAGRFERAVADGELPAGTDVAALASYFVAVMQGLSVQASLGATAGQLEAVVATAMRAWPTTEAVTKTV